MPDILVTTQDGVAVVRLNRPEVRNAVKLAMWRELAELFSRLAGDDAVRAMILAGSGADLLCRSRCNGVRPHQGKPRAKCGLRSFGRRLFRRDRQRTQAGDRRHLGLLSWGRLPPGAGL